MGDAARYLSDPIVELARGPKLDKGRILVGVLPGAAAARSPSHRLNERSNAADICLQCSETLFRSGEPRLEGYRVEAGALLVSIGDHANSVAAWEIARRGDYLGLGFLEVHTTSAHALTDSTVSCYSLCELEAFAAHDDKLLRQLKIGVERQFEMRRLALVGDSQGASPLHRVARLLIALSKLASREGLPLNAISDSLSCEFITELLGIELDTMTCIMADLAERGLIQTDRQSGIVLVDCIGLEVACELTSMDVGPN